ncbi:MAG: hypothetical protein ACLUE1_03975 [Adlercreutzia equolifaciens]
MSATGVELSLLASATAHGSDRRCHLRRHRGLATTISDVPRLAQVVKAVAEQKEAA